MRLIFMGTPDFAVPSLAILVEQGYSVVAVVTATDKLGGRGGKELIQSAVKKYAVEKNIPVLQPEKLRDPDFIAQLQSYQADLQIVVAFRMLPEVVWKMPPLGTVNLHGSLLPAYRGAAPINWAVIRGEKETGVTTFFLKQAIDTGDTLLSAKLSIDDNETAGDIHDRMMLLGAETVLKSVQLIQNGVYVATPQDETKTSAAPKLFTETCEINFQQTTAEVHNFIRGLSPFPTAWTHLNGELLKIFKASKELALHDLAAGTWVSDHKSYLKVATLDGYICLELLQLQGKKRMNVRDFLNGYKTAKF
jgi:methionyl-tRNA formyltransferase